MKKGDRLKRWLWRTIRVALGAYIGLTLVLAFMQSRFIFPGAASQGRPEAIVRPTDGGELVTLTARTGDKVTALFGAALTRNGQPHPDAASRPTIVYFYGNGMCMADCAAEFAEFRRGGFNMIVADFVGYGMSGGKPSETGVYATADACYDYLLTRKDIDPKRIVPFGWSLGAAGAVHLASTRQTPALVMVSAFTSITDMARRLYPYLPTSLILRHRFENEEKIRGIRCPIFIGHGKNDRIIPFDMSEKLAASAGGKVVKYDVNNGDHNDVFYAGGGDFLDAISQFIEEAR